MSWTYDFGLVSDTRDLRDHQIDLGAPAPDVSPSEREAQIELVDVARRMALTAMEDVAFGDAPVSVVASGQATPNHEPYEGKTIEVEHESKGEVWTSEEKIEPDVFEQITLTLTQQFEERT